MVTGDPLLEVRHVAKAFGRKSVLKDVSFLLSAGRIAGITGENGAGKSTLLKIIVGWLAPAAGRVLRRGPVGFCPQELAVFETLTVAENFAYFAAAYGLDGAGRASDWKGRQRLLLHRFRFEPYERTLVAALSGGTKQKLNFSLSVLHEPSLLILDEPYSGFDWETYLLFWEYAAELKARGTAILIVSHFVHDRSRFDAVYELNAGVLRCA
jgi:ABC-type multidrug transport system ATPase subunit